MKELALKILRKNSTLMWMAQDTRTLFQQFGLRMKGKARKQLNKRVELCLSRKPSSKLAANSGFSANLREREEMLREITEKYREIRLYGLWSNRIGESIPRCLWIIHDQENKREADILDVFVAEDVVHCNSQVMKMMKNHFTIVDRDNADAWAYILSNFRGKVHYSKYWNTYGDRTKPNVPVLDPAKTAGYFQFTEEEETICRAKMEAMGLDRPFVCAASRDSAYLAATQPKVDAHHNDFRDSDISLMDSAAEYLAGKGITMVRMGRIVNKRADFPNCIDYASDYYDERMDVYLMQHCKFYFGEPHGLAALPMAMNKPCAIKNNFFDGAAFACFPQRSDCLMICLKYYKESEQRFLSLREMFAVDKNAGFRTEGYAKQGITPVENSAEEMRDLAFEMNARLDGEWVETEEDAILQEKFQKIYAESQEREHVPPGGALKAKMGAMFLRKNPFLLAD